MVSWLVGVLTAAGATLAPSVTENAIANGDTRTINLFHAHTQESISATYLVNGQYDRAVLQQLNWFLRDWRRDEPTTMDPRLFDVVWEAYRGAGAQGQTVRVVSAYRSPETNAMLRQRSRAVAKFSQHMLGKAMDTTMPGMPMSQIREIGMRMQRGGVGYYPNAGTPFVHLDVGSVRAWPRMTYDQLVRLFPDGRTVHLPSNGQPLPGYYEAKAEIEARNNGAIVAEPRKSGGGLLAFLFGGGEDEEESVAEAPAPSTRKQWASLAPRMARAGRGGGGEDEEGAAPAEASGRRRRSDTIARAESNLPRGETAISTPANDAPQKPAAPEKIAAAPPPPVRPISIDRPADIPTPPSKPIALAQLNPVDAGGSGLRNSLAEAEPVPAAAEPPARTGVEAPLPPHRPAGLVFASADAPLPPSRPMALATATAAAGPAAAIATVMSGAGAAARPEAVLSAPSADTQPTTANDASGVQAVLAYAPPTGAAPQDRAPATATQSSEKTGASVAPRGEFVPARLDRSNFRALTGATPASRVSGGSVLGSSMTAVRSAARATEPGLFGPPAVKTVASFSTPLDEPPTDKFASPALHTP